MQTFFISSTFRDMHSERDCMHKEIIPKLNAEALEYGESIAIRDLRWGVDTTDEKSEEEVNRKVLNICLNEIDACRPYMIVLLGERYGFMPGKVLIQEAVSGRDKFSLPEDIRDISITELEIRYGALWNKTSSLRPKVIFYTREFIGEIPAEFQAESEECQKKLSDLKQCIGNLPREDAVIQTYRVKWEEEKGSLDMGSFAGRMEEDIRRLMQDEWNVAENKTDCQKELKRHREFAERKGKNYWARKEIEEEIKGLLKDGYFAAIQGEPGSGKSMLMSHLAEEFPKEEGTEVIPLFCGYTPLTCQGIDLIKLLTAFLAEKLPKSDDNEWDDKTADWLKWRRRLEICVEKITAQYKQEGKRIIILLDAVDQLQSSEIRDNLLFFPDHLSPQVQVVLSCVQGFPLLSWADKVVELKPLSKDRDIDGILEEGFRSFGKEANPGILNWIKENKKTDNPLYLSLLVQRLAMMEKSDFEQIDAGGNYNTASFEHQRRILEDCPDDLQGLCCKILDVASVQVGAEIAEKATKYLSVSRYGLRETDLEGILGADVWNSLEFARFYNYMRNLFVLREDGRYDFLHRSIREGYLKRYQAEQTDLHKKILAHLQGLFPNDVVRMNELLYHCYQADDRDYFLEYISKCQDGEKPQKRLEATARSLHEICVMDCLWVCRTLETCRPWDRPKETAAILEFIYTYLNRTFDSSPVELEIQKNLYTQCLLLAESLNPEIEKEQGTRILANACYHLGNVCRRLGGPDHYIRTLRLYLREREMTESLSGNQKTQEKERQTESLFHLGDIYASLGGRENRNRALRLYRKAKEIAGAPRYIWKGYQKIGDMYLSGGCEDYAYAEKMYQSAEKIMESAPDSLNYQKEQMKLCIRMGDALLGEGRRKEALQYYRKAEMSAAEMTREPPAKTNKWNWLICRERTVFAAGAEKFEEPYAAIHRELEMLKESLGLTYSARATAVFLEHEGSILLRKKGSCEEIQKARKKFQEAEAKLKEPGNGRDFMVICCKLGDVSFIQGELQEAFSFYQKAWAMAEQIKRETGTAQSRTDCMVIKTRQGDLYSSMNPEKYRQMAEDCYLYALEVAISLEKNRRTPAGMMDVSILCKKIAAISSNDRIKICMEQKARQMAESSVSHIHHFDLHCAPVMIEDE